MRLALHGHDGSLLERLVPWGAVVTLLLWSPLILSRQHSFDDADPEILNNAYRLSRGQPLYHGIASPPWIVNPYTPLYLASVAAALKVTGLSYLPARLICFLATTAVAAGLANLARRWRGDAREGLWATSLLLVVPGVLYNCARPHPQMMAVALSVWSFTTFENRRWLLANVLSPLLAVLAIYTKQTGIVLPSALLLWLLWRDRSRLPYYAGALALFGLAPLPWLQATTQGAFLDCVVGMNLLIYNIWQIPSVLIEHAGIFFLFIGLALYRLLGRLQTRSIGPGDFYFAGVALTTIASLGRIGAYSQYVVELLVVTVLYLLQTGGLRFPLARKRLATAQLALVLAYGPAFVLLQEGPWDWASLRAAPMVRALLETAPGPIISQQGSFSLFTRGEIHIQLFHFAALTRMGKWDQGPLIEEVERHSVAWVVTEFPLEGSPQRDSDRERFTSELHKALTLNYVRRAHIGPYYVYVAKEPPKGTNGTSRLPRAAVPLSG